jgi:hypothetical protein
LKGRGFQPRRKSGKINLGFSRWGPAEVEASFSANWEAGPTAEHIFAAQKALRHPKASLYPGEGCCRSDFGGGAVSLMGSVFFKSHLQNGQRVASE